MEIDPATGHRELRRLMPVTEVPVADPGQPLKEELQVILRHRPEEPVPLQLARLADIIDPNGRHRVRHHDIDFVEVDGLHDRLHFGFGEEFFREPGLPGLTEFLINRERAAHEKVTFAIQLQSAPARHVVKPLPDPDRLIASVLRDEFPQQLMVLVIAVAEIHLRLIIHERIKEVSGFRPRLLKVTLSPIPEIPDHDRHIGLQFLQRVIHEGEFGVRVTDKKHLLFLCIFFTRHLSLSSVSVIDLSGVRNGYPPSGVI